MAKNGVGPNWLTWSVSCKLQLSTFFAAFIQRKRFHSWSLYELLCINVRFDRKTKRLNVSIPNLVSRNTNGKSDSRTLQVLSKELSLDLQCLQRTIASGMFPFMSYWLNCIYDFVLVIILNCSSLYFIGERCY